MYLTLLGCLALGACETTKLANTPPAKQDSIPVHRAASNDPEGPAFGAQTKGVRAVETLGEKVTDNGPATADTVSPAPPAQDQQVASLPARTSLPNLSPQTQKVGLLLPLSGPRRLVGQELLDAAQIAIFDLADKNFVIYPFDTKGTEAGAAKAAAAATKAGVQLILGPLLASSVKAVRPIAARAGISVVAFSNSRQVAGDGVFILGFVPQQQVDAVIDYAVSEGLFRYAALVPNDAYGRAVVAAFRQAAREREAEIVRVEYYDPAATDFSGPAKVIADYDRRHKALLEQIAELETRDDEISKQAIKRLEKLDTIGEVEFDAVLLPARGQQLKAVASLLSYYDVDQPAVRLLGLSNWGQTANIESEPSLNQGWYAAPPRAERENFFKRFAELYRRPPIAIASLAYDATALAIVLSQTHRSNAFSRGNLVQPYGFLGVDGLFRLREEGAAERVFEIREVTRKGFKIRRPAATEFPQAGG